jgi:glycosyltransferase involved in cell wall biosynthesis
MHIVFVSREYIPSLRGGGIATYVRNVAEALVTVGHKVTVIRASDDTRLSNDETINDVHVISLSGGDFVIPAIEGQALLKKFRGIYRFYSYRKKIRKAIDSLTGIDVIEVPEFGAEGLYLQDMNIPVICRLHTPALLNRLDSSIMKLSVKNFYFYFQGIKEVTLLKKQKYITSCSRSLAEWIEKYAGIDKKRIDVIYNPVVDIDLKITNNVFTGSNRILFAGTVVEEKGVLDLFEAGKLLADNSLFSMELAGNKGKAGEMLDNQRISYKWLKILGKLPHEQLMRKYQDASVVCFPSWWNNFPMVCIEAMMCGAIVIGSSSGGMSEIITDGKDGFLLEPRNPRKWADKIKEVFALPPDERSRISQNAQKTIRKKFSMEAILPQMVEYYEDVIKQHKLAK